MPLTEDRTQFYKTLRVGDYECDIKGLMKPGYILRHMQEISGEHLDALELPYEKLAAMGQVFLLSQILLTLARRPRAGEALCWRTTPKEPAGARFIRCNAVEDEKGDTILRADTTWMLVEPATRKILRPAAFLGLMPRSGAFEKAALQRMRLATPEQTQPVFERTVRYADADVNRHLNNAVYVDMLCDAVPFEALEQGEPTRLYIHYQSEALLGAELRVSRAPIEGGWYVCADKPEGRCFEAALWF